MGTGQVCCGHMYAQETSIYMLRNQQVGKDNYITGQYPSNKQTITEEETVWAGTKWYRLGLILMMSEEAVWASTKQNNQTVSE